MKSTYIIKPACLLLISFYLFSVWACNSNSNDEVIKKHITTELYANENYKNVEVAVADGVVSLSGTCDGENCSGQIGDIVKKVKGVKSVDNKIARSETDLTLRSSVQSIISKYQGVQADVAAGVVVLRGSIDRSQLQPLMSELEALRPQKIDNQLAINQ